jgi:hypothetical protein
MNQRKTIDEKIDIQIKPATDYRESILVSELLATKDILPTDTVIGIGYVEKEERSFGMDEPKTFYTPILRVIRKRPETDEEYSKRMEQEAKTLKDVEEREKLEYLRLKAKFEPRS